MNQLGWSVSSFSMGTSNKPDAVGLQQFIKPRLIRLGYTSYKYHFPRELTPSMLLAEYQRKCTTIIIFHLALLGEKLEKKLPSTSAQSEV